MLFDLLVHSESATPPPKTLCPDVSRCQEDSSRSPQSDDSGGATPGSESQMLEGDEIFHGFFLLERYYIYCPGLSVDCRRFHLKIFCLISRTGKQTTTRWMDRTKTLQQQMASEVNISVGIRFLQFCFVLFSLQNQNLPKNTEWRASVQPF